jgi:hypothetical protein
MFAMTWIKIIPPADADPELHRCYDEVYGLYPPEYDLAVPAVVRPDGTVDSVVAAHSLIPQAMRHLLSGFGALLSPALPLSRRQHEMITTLVSALNRCFY